MTGVFHDAMLMASGELLQRRLPPARRRNPVCRAIECDGGNSDSRHRGEASFHVVELRVAFYQSKPMPVLVNDHIDKVGIVESRSGAGEGVVAKLPGG
jgi:hypothetical protein